MKIASPHPEELRRLQALESLQILDTSPEAEFNNLVKIASQICQTPIALVSLIDKDRQWFKAKVGLDANQTPRDYAFCAHAILSSETFVVEDSKKDTRFSDNPLVTGAPNVEFYAGVPVFDPSSKLPLGTLCVIDHSPRKLTAEQKEGLELVARQVEVLLKLRTEIKRVAALEAKSADITKHLEEAQKIAHLGSWEFDLEKNRVHWSPELYRIFGIDLTISLDELFPEYRRRIDPRDVPDLDRAVNKCIQSGIAYTIVHRIVIPGNKDLKFVHCYGERILPTGSQPMRIIGTCQDVTEKIKAEEEVAAAQVKSAHLNKLIALGEMSAGVAHEINNPLAIIQGAVPLLKRARNDEVKFIERVESIEKAVVRIGKIVAGLKRFSRAEDQEKFTPAKLGTILVEAMIMVEARAKRSGVDLSIRIDKDSEILCDSLEIEQVVVNLINNAVDAAKILDEKWVRVEILQDGNEAVLRVIDSGSGISKEIEDKIFHPFFTTKPVGEGTGLGLSICIGIVERHHGQLKLNRESKNTCFEARLPIKV